MAKRLILLTDFSTGKPTGYNIDRISRVTDVPFVPAVPGAPVPVGSPPNPDTPAIPQHAKVEFYTPTTAYEVEVKETQSAIYSSANS